MQDTILVTKHVVSRASGGWMPVLLVMLVVVGLFMWQRTSARPLARRDTRPSDVQPPNDR